MISKIHPARVLLASLLASGLALGGLTQGVAFAQPPWSDNFDSYVAGSQMIGQGGWTGWDNNPAVGALVSNAFAHSSPNSVAVTGPTDLVHTYSGYTSGRAVYTAWQYIPNTFSGTTYFILLNQYNVGGAKNWSVQVHFESASGRVISDFDGGSLALVRGRWVQIRVEVDLDLDTQTFYYDNMPLYTNSPLYTKSWPCGVSCNRGAVRAGGGRPQAWRLVFGWMHGGLRPAMAAAPPATPPPRVAVPENLA